MPIHKDIQALQRAAQDQGWTVTITGGDHLKWVGPNGTGVLFYSSATPSDYRTIRNLKAKLTKAGLSLEDTAVTRRRKVKLVSGRVSFLDSWFEAEDEARINVIEKARVILNLPLLDGEDKVRAAAQALTTGQRKALSELIINDEPLDLDCVCGKTFTGALFAYMHRKKCLLANGEIPIEPKNPAVARNGKKERVSRQSVTMPDVTIDVPVAPQPDTDREVTMPDPTPAPTTTAYPCSDCPKSFDTKHGLNAHSAVHTPWKCQDCGQEMPINGKGNHLRACAVSKTPNALRMIRCKYCHKAMQLRSLAQHQWQFCGAVKAAGAQPNPDKDWYLPYQASNEVVPVPDGVAALPEPELAGPAPVLDDQPPVVAPASPKPAATEDSDEELITILLDLIFPDGFKARHLSAIGKWTECTATLLKEVRGT